MPQTKFDLNTLTPRERDYAKYVAHGWTDEEIAAALKISHQTVKNGFCGIYKQLRSQHGPMNRVKLARLLILSGYFTEDLK